MSRSTNCTFTCPCGEVFDSLIYEYVNTAHDPQLRYTVLAGLLNICTCPNCGRRSALARPFIYSDPAHALLAYVHPSTAVPEEARQLILEKLRAVYLEAEASDDYQGSSKGTNRKKSAKNGNGHSTSTETKQPKEASMAEASAATTISDAGQQSIVVAARSAVTSAIPPLRVVFGLDQLYELINAELSQHERLGRLALSTHSRRDAERGQLLDIVRKFASEMQCQVEVEDMPDEYVVWLYGSRRQIGAIMRELTPQG